MNILGISALYHDSAACLVRDGEILAAAQEERFSRVKGDARIPRAAIDYCLGEGKVGRNEIDVVVFYDKPITKFARLMTTYSQVAPRGFKSFMMAIPAWIREKAWIPLQIERCLHELGYARPKQFRFTEHHHAHAASAFFPSPYPAAAILTNDGVGEWVTTTVGVGEANQMKTLFEQRFPHSLGLLYSAFTYFTGFKVNSGEYKLMGLAPYGSPRYVDQIKDHLISIREDGSFRLNLEYFGFLDGLTMTNDHFAKLFGGPARKPESQITTREMDLARSIQWVTEEIVLKMARFTRSVTGKSHLCLAGGVALNCVANGLLLRERIFDSIWIQPAAGDAGGALGAALYHWYHILGNQRVADGHHDRMRGAFLGPEFKASLTQEYLDTRGFPYHVLSDDEVEQVVADAVAEEQVVGLFAGRMEFGPRALCHRSILADARSPKMQSYLNLATKFRESFRPFAPIVLAEHAHEFFDQIHDSPYMLLVDQVHQKRLKEVSPRKSEEDLTEWVNQERSEVPAITHVDNSARIQTIDRTRNPRMHRILTKFHERTSCPVMVNTSFNVRSEPIVCTPEDAYVCFMRTGMDVLVLDNLVLYKKEQPEWTETEDWRESFTID